MWNLKQIVVRGGTLLLVICGALALLKPARAADLARDAMLEALTRMESSYARINDYTAIFRKQERVNGKLLSEETIFLKFQKPLKVYMKWIKNPYEGTETLFVKGKYGNKLLVHRGGILGFLTLSLDPGGSTAMKRNRHPITDVGFGFLITGLKTDLHSALGNGALEIIRLGEETFQGRPATVLESRTLPREGHKYYAPHLICHIDRELSLPVGVAIFNEREELIEKYSYSEVRFNVGLTEKDFSRYNTDYRF